MKKRIYTQCVWIREHISRLSKAPFAMSILMLMAILTADTLYAAESYAQKVNLNLHYEDEAVGNVLKEIENQTEFTFFYNNRQVDVNRKVSISIENGNIFDILETIFAGTDVSYSVIDKNIILSDELSKISNDEDTAAPQEMTINGVVKDESGAPLIGAAIMLKGSATGAITNTDGRFSINAGESDVLVISMLGYVQQEIPVGTRTTFDITLEEDSQLIDDVVVVGYGVQKKASAVGAISSIKGDALTATPAVNLSSVLAGQAPGLMAITRSGEPGNDGATLRIRGLNTLGDNSPLIVIDGVANRQGGLDRIDPSDIESISVLKDASAAIYGAQAANGVILVTTKRGSAGKAKVTYSYNHGFAQATRFPEMADAPTYATMMNELAEYRGNSPVYTAEEIQKFANGSDPWLYPNTDWFALIMKKISPQHKQNLTISGGTDRINYFVSAGNIGQDGFYNNSGTRYDQWSLRSNFDIKFSDYFKLDVGLNAREEKRTGLITSNYYEVVMKAKPTAIGFWPNGLPGPAVEGNNNPAIGASKEAGYNRTKNYYVQTNFKLEITNPWVKGLKLTLNAAYDKRMQYSKQFRKLMTTYNWDKISYDDNGEPVLVPYVQASNQADPDLSESTRDYTNMVMNALLSYDKRIADDHNINVLLGTESFDQNSNYFSAYRRHYISDAIDELFAGGDLDLDNDGSSSRSTRQNYFGRFYYSFKDKYLFEFVGRYDGSYIFPQQGRYGFFPGFMVGWVASEENFWKEYLSAINYFKIRASWGQTGNDRVSPYQFLSSFRYSSTNLVLGETVENQALSSSRIGNPNITWEVANQANIAFEAQMFRGKLAFGMDFFYNKRSQMLIARNASIPGYTGMTLPSENIGTMENKGIDFDITWRDKAGALGYSFTVNGGYAKNKILFWDEAPGVVSYQQSTGHPMNTSLYYRSLGIFKTQSDVDNYPHWSGARPGDIIFEDVDGNGKIDSEDRVRIDKNDVPTFTGSFTATLNYKGFDFIMMFQGATGAVAYVKTFSGQVGNYLKDFADNRWTTENPSSEYPRAFNRDEEYWRSQQNTYFLKNTDYIRLKNIELGYSLPKSILAKTPIQNLRVYVSGFNLLTFDKLKVFDPEGNVSTGQFYPQQKVYNVGASITF
jgi:TonB-linked SusC/RagA family outer membrane protein